MWNAGQKRQPRLACQRPLASRQLGPCAKPGWVTRRRQAQIRQESRGNEREVAGLEKSAGRSASTTTPAGCGQALQDSTSPVLCGRVLPVKKCPPCPVCPPNQVHSCLEPVVPVSLPACLPRTPLAVRIGACTSTCVDRHPNAPGANSGAVTAPRPPCVPDCCYWSACSFLSSS